MKNWLAKEFLCPRCLSWDVVKDGKSGGGKQRFFCRACHKKASVGQPADVLAFIGDIATRTIAKRLLAYNFPVTAVAEATDLPRRTVQQYSKEIAGRVRVGVLPGLGVDRGRGGE